jgi:hypothetical protein
MCGSQVFWLLELPVSIECRYTDVAGLNGQGMEIIHMDGWMATPSAELFLAFLLLVASSGSNTEVAWIPYILLIIWANYLFSFLYFRRFDSNMLTKQLDLVYSHPSHDHLTQVRWYSTRSTVYFAFQDKSQMNYGHPLLILYSTSLNCEFRCLSL